MSGWSKEELRDRIVAMRPEWRGRIRFNRYSITVVGRGSILIGEDYLDAEPIRAGFRDCDGKYDWATHIVHDLA